MMAALALQGGALVLLAWSRVYPLSVAALVAAGFGMVTFVSSVHALLQTLASETMRGRVIGAYVFTFLGLGPLGSLAVGALAEVWGVPVMICLSGLVALAVSAGYGLGRPDIRML
jgi:MFS family permease